MKDFILKYKKRFIIILSVVVILIVSITALTIRNAVPNEKVRSERILKLSTCSTPTGNIVCKGIDVSSYQENIDFNKVKSQGFDFVILRAGTGLGMDEKFNDYYKQATDAGLDIGCYFYSYATNVDEAEKEAKDVIEFINGKTFTYPVFYDFEYPELLSYDRIEINTNMINAFCSEIKLAGYYPGVYTSSHIHRDFINTEDINIAWDVWIANYGDYSGSDNHSQFSSSFSMWQYTDRGSVDGISTDVDINICFVDYPSIIKDFREKYDRI